MWTQPGNCPRRHLCAIPRPHRLHHPPHRLPTGMVVNALNSDFLLSFAAVG
jgi:hypothetical protein